MAAAVRPNQSKSRFRLSPRRARTNTHPSHGSASVCSFVSVCLLLLVACVHAMRPRPSVQGHGRAGQGGWEREQASDRGRRAIKASSRGQVRWGGDGLMAGRGRVRWAQAQGSKEVRGPEMAACDASKASVSACRRRPKPKGTSARRNLDSSEESMKEKYCSG